MPTLHDRMRLRQWQQEVESATLSLAEIAERWAHLECGEDADDELATAYLKEIAGELNARRQRRERLERAVMPPPNNAPYTHLTSAADPWQVLHMIQEKLRKAATGDREAATELRFTDLMLRTCLNGSASQPPVGLFPRPPDPQLHAERDHINAQRNQAAPEMPAGVEEDVKTPQQRGAEIANSRYRAAEKHCVDLAKQIWEQDERVEEDRRMHKQEMLGLLQKSLGHEGMTQPTDDVLWKWLTEAGIVPEYARTRGRKPKYR